MSKRIPSSDAESNKRRFDAWEIKARISDADLHRVFSWCRQLGYARAQQLIKAELKIEPPGKTALSDWYDWYSKNDNADRIHKAIVDGAAIRDLAKECGDVSEAMVAALESEASAAILGDDPNRIKLLVSLALKARGARRSDELMKLEIRKYQDAVQSSIEKGLAALADQAKGKPEALKYFKLFKAEVMKRMNEVAA